MQGHLASPLFLTAAPPSFEQEAWDLPTHGSLSAWLLLLITFGAVVGTAIYEKRIWCRYLCPVGGMNGAAR